MFHTRANLNFALASNWTAGVQYGTRKVIFLFAAASRPSVEIIQPSVQVTGSSLQGSVKLISSASDFELKEAGISTSAVSYTFTAWSLIGKRKRNTVTVFITMKKCFISAFFVQINLRSKLRLFYFL
jgi:hypothetical protein